MAGIPSSIPRLSKALAWSRSRATSFKAQIVMHRSCRHCPPILSLSMSLTCAPPPARRIAPSLPAGPPPMTTIMVTHRSSTPSSIGIARISPVNPLTSTIRLPLRTCQTGT